MHIKDDWYDQVKQHSYKISINVDKNDNFEKLAIQTELDAHIQMRNRSIHEF